MANNYMEFSEEITDLTPAEIVWWNEEHAKQLVLAED